MEQLGEAPPDEFDDGLSSELDEDQLEDPYVNGDGSGEQYEDAHPHEPEQPADLEHPNDPGEGFANVFRRAWKRQDHGGTKCSRLLLSTQLFVCFLQTLQWPWSG